MPLFLFSCFIFNLIIFHSCLILAHKFIFPQIPSRRRVKLEAFQDLLVLKNCLVTPRIHPTHTLGSNKWVSQMHINSILSLPSSICLFLYLFFSFLTHKRYWLQRTMSMSLLGTYWKPPRILINLFFLCHNCWFCLQLTAAEEVSSSASPLGLVQGWPILILSVLDTLVFWCFIYRLLLWSFSMSTFYSCRMDNFLKYSSFHHANGILTDQSSRALHTCLIMSDSRFNTDWVIMGNAIYLEWTNQNRVYKTFKSQWKGKVKSNRTKALYVSDFHSEKFKTLCHY